MKEVIRDIVGDLERAVSDIKRLTESRQQGTAEPRADYVYIVSAQVLVQNAIVWLERAAEESA